MIEQYCGGVHRAGAAPCAECADLLAYASRRLEHCPYGGTKPACVKCPIHCYHPRRREQVKAVMRYAGPRMLLRHPYLAIRHWLDGRKDVPPMPPRGQRGGDAPGARREPVADARGADGTEGRRAAPAARNLGLERAS